MSDGIIHSNDEGFEEFVEQALSRLGLQAQDEKVCIECLSDRLIFELVAGMVRSGVSKATVLAAVGDGLDAAGEDDASEQQDRSGWMH